MSPPIQRRTRTGAWPGTRKRVARKTICSVRTWKSRSIARAEGVIPPGMKSIGGTWSTITDSGEATYLNMIHLTGYDGTDVHDLTRAEIEGRYQALQAIKALNHFAPGFEKAKLRNYGMTVGV